MDGLQGALPEDEAFWSSVLKKWSETCDNVVSLKKDLKKAQAESNQHQEQIHVLQAQENNMLRERDRLQEECHRIWGKHSQQAENGLERAKNGYTKMKDQLSKSNEQIRALQNEIKALQLEKEVTEENNCVLTKENIRIEIELTYFRSEYDALKKQPIELQALRDQNEALRVGFVAQTRELKDKVTHQKEIQILKAAANADKQEVSALRDELVLMREKLFKANDTNKTLLDNFTKLNEKLRDPSLTHTPPQPLRHPQPNPPKEEPTPEELDVQDSTSAYWRIGSRIFIRPSTSPRNSNTASTSTKVPPQQSAMQPVSAFTAPMLIPNARQHSLTQLVHYIPDIDREGCQFRRATLAGAIGGGIQSLIVRVTRSQTELAKTRNISTYLCPALELNPWCPTSPGQHGFMFVGLGQEQNTFQEPQAGLNVFVGHSRLSSRPKEYRYLGVYTAVRVAGLDVAEWGTLSKEVKYGYASMTKDKNKDPRSVEQILAAYNVGELSVPCVRLQCTDFDETLYTALVAAQLNPSPTRTSRAAGKRRRDDCEDHQPQPRAARRSLSDEQADDESGISPFTRTTMTRLSPCL